MNTNVFIPYPKNLFFGFGIVLLFSMIFFACATHSDQAATEDVYREIQTEPNDSVPLQEQTAKSPNTSSNPSSPNTSSNPSGSHDFSTVPLQEQTIEPQNSTMPQEPASLQKETEEAERRKMGDEVALGMKGGEVDFETKSAPKKSSLSMPQAAPKSDDNQVSASSSRAPNPPVSLASPTPLDKNAYYQNTYQGGRGSKERIEKLINEGVIVDGRQVKLEAFAHDYAQVFSIPTDSAMSLSTNLERTAIVAQGGKTYLQIGLQSIAQETPQRPPLNIAFVLDVSGSMGDEGKISFAKTAALAMIDRLTTQDRLALITYSDGARVLSPSASVKDPKRLKTMINQISAGGGTNIYAGLDLGYAEAMRGFTEDGANLVILLSDGQVTVGEQNPKRFQSLADQYFQKEIQTTTIGVGIDFNDKLMIDIAQAGKGNYHFIKDSASIAGIFHTELDDLSHIVARALKVRITFNDTVHLTKVFGSRELQKEESHKVRSEEQQIDRKVYEELGITQDRQNESEEGTKIFIPHFYMNDNHVVMLELDIPPGQNGSDLSIAKVSLKYKDLVFRKNQEMQAGVKIAYVDQKQDMIATIQQPVKKNLLGFETGETLLAAASSIAHGRLDEAIRSIDDRMVVLGVAAQEWKDSDLDRDGKLLAQYRDVLIHLTRDQVAHSDLGKYIEKSLTFAAFQRTQ